MNFTPKTEEEIKKSSLLEKGDYPFEVRKAESKISKAGNPMIELMLCIWDDSGREHFVFDYLMESAIYKLKHFCDSVGLHDLYKSGKLEDRDCISKQGVCKLIIKEDKTGQYAPKNSVADYFEKEKVTISGNIAKKVSSETDDKFDDDIPF